MSRCIAPAADALRSALERERGLSGVETDTLINCRFGTRGSFGTRVPTSLAVIRGLAGFVTTREDNSWLSPQYDCGARADLVGFDFVGVAPTAFAAVIDRIAGVGIAGVAWSTFDHGYDGLVYATLLLPSARPLNAREYTDTWFTWEAVFGSMRCLPWPSKQKYYLGQPVTGVDWPVRGDRTIHPDLAWSRGASAWSGVAID